MEIINAPKAKKLNSQITCTSHYDFPTKKRRCLDAFNCMDRQQDKEDRGKYYEVDDNATEWYLGTRASPIKKPLVSHCKFSSEYHPKQHPRRRRLKAISHPVPGRRASPEFLSLLKQQYDRTKGHLHRKSRRPKAGFSYYKYDAEGKCRHMRPGIDTAAPLEFPNPMEMDDTEYRRWLLRGHGNDSHAPLRSKEEPHRHYQVSPRTKRIRHRYVRRTRDKGIQKNIETGNNPSVPEPPHLHDPPCLVNSRDQLATCICPSGQMAIPLGRRKRIKCPRLISSVKGGFLKAIHHGKVNQGISDGNNNMEMFRSCEEMVSDDSVCKIHTANSSEKPEVPDNKCKGILRDITCSKVSAFGSVSRKIKKKVRIASCNYISPNNLKGTNTYACKINPKIKKPKEARLTEKPNSSDNRPENNKRHLPCVRPLCTRNVACQHNFIQKRTCTCATQKNLTETNIYGYKMNPEIIAQEEARLTEGEHEKHENSSVNTPENSGKPYPCVGTPYTVTDACQHFHQMRTCTCSTQKDLIETDPYESKVQTEIMEQESGLGVRENENPNFSGNSPDNSGRPLCYEGSSRTRTVAEPSYCYHLRTNQSKRDSSPNCRKVEKPKPYTKIRNTCPRSGPPKEDQNHSNFCQKKTSKCFTQRELTRTKTCVSKVNMQRENGKPNCRGKSPDYSGRPLRCRGSSSTRTVAVPSSGCHLKTNQSKKKIVDNSCNCRKVKKLQVTPNSDPNRNKKCCPFKPLQLRKCRTNSCENSKPKERNCCPETHCNSKRWPTKPIPIRCDPITKKCVPFPNSSGNEKTDLKRWLYPRCQKTGKTPCKRCRATRKCHQSDSSSCCVQITCRVGQQQGARSASCCRCPCCSSLLPPICSCSQEVQFPSTSRGQENYQRCCPHRKRWHCKPICQENSQGYCEKTCYGPTVSRYWESRRTCGGVDLREDDDFIPERNRGVPQSFSSSLLSESDSKYTKSRKWSGHAFCFD